MEDARRPSEAPFPSSITPTGGPPPQRRERGRGYKERASEGGIWRRPRLGIVNREGDLSERGGHSAFAARRRRGRSNNSAHYAFYTPDIFPREKGREKIARIDGAWCSYATRWSWPLTLYNDSTGDFTGANEQSDGWWKCDNGLSIATRFQVK